MVKNHYTVQNVVSKYSPQPYVPPLCSCVCPDQRIHDIKFWRQELDQKLEEIVQEIEVLIIFKNRVEKALESCAEPLRVTLLCLEERLRVRPFSKPDIQSDVVKATTLPALSG